MSRWQLLFLAALAVAMGLAFVGRTYVYGPEYRTGVDAFFKADRSGNRFVAITRDLASLEACQEWGRAEAESRGDADLDRGEIICGIDPMENPPAGRTMAYRRIWSSADDR